MSKSATRPSPQARPTSKNTKQQNTKKQNAKNRAARQAQASRSGRPSPRGGRAQASFRSRHPVLTALVPVGLVVAAIATMVVIKAAGGSSGPSSSHLTAGGTPSSADTGASALPQSVLASLSVPAATLDSVGNPAAIVPPSRAGGSGTILRGADGKPVITYVGAEYCPYCAAERWALAVALSRFGTFSHLSATHSASGDIYPNTQTLSFYGSSYTSPYLDFQPVEEATNQQSGNTYQALQAPTAAQSSLLSTYDSAGTIPFLDIGNKFVINGASYSPQVLQGLSRTQIAAALSDPSSPVAQAVDGTANNITAAICSVTGNQPANVCTSPAISAIAKKIGA